MAITAERLTAEQYRSLPLDRRTQLIDGEVIVNSPRWRHQEITGFLYHRFCTWIDEGDARGKASLPVDFELGLDQVYDPDVVWFDDAHAPTGDDVPRFTEPPQLAVEVRSESTWRYDIGRKKQVYEATGLAELWLVDTASDSVLVYRRSSPGSTSFDVALELRTPEDLTSPQLQGFSLPIAELFDR